MTKRILMMSQHPILDSQKQWLTEFFKEEVEVIPDRNSFDSAAEIAKRYRAGNYDDIIVVAPLTVLQKLVELGIRPLYAVMQQVPVEDAEVVVKGRGQRFEVFKRVVGLDLKLENL